MTVKMPPTYTYLFFLVLLGVPDAITNNSVFSTTKETPSMIAMTNEAISGTSGTDSLSLSTNTQGTELEMVQTQTRATTAAATAATPASQNTLSVVSRRSTMSTTTAAPKTTKSVTSASNKGSITTSTTGSNKNPKNHYGYVVVVVIIVVCLIVILSFCICNKKKQYSLNAQNAPQEDAGMPLNTVVQEALESVSPKEPQTFGTNDTQDAPESPKVEAGEGKPEKDKGNPGNSTREDSTSCQSILTSDDMPEERLLNVKQFDTDVSHQTSVEPLKDQMNENRKSSTENATATEGAVPTTRVKIDKISNIPLYEPL